MTRHDPIVSIRQMLEFASKAQRLGEGLPADRIENDELLSLALPHAIEIIGEAANRIPEEERLRFPAIPWSQAIRMRNRLAHGYDTVDFNLVAATIRDDIPPLIAALEAILRAVDDGGV